MKKTTPPVPALLPAPKYESEEKKQKMPSGQAHLNVDKLDPNRPADQANSLLQFIILTIAQSLALPPKKVLSLLVDGCNYFAHLLVKGVKGSYEQLMAWLEQLRSLNTKFVELSQKDPQRNLQFILQLLKPGLLSKSEGSMRSNSDIVRMTVQLLIELFELMRKDNEQWLYKELCQEASLVQTIYLSLRRHPHLIVDLIQLIFCIGQDGLGDFFIIYFRKSASSDTQYLKVALLLLDAFVEHEHYVKLVESAGIVVSWFKLCETLSISTTETIDTKIYATELMCRLCLQFPEVIDEVDSSLDTLLEILKKHCRGISQLLKILSINKLFEMLEHTARIRSHYAPLLYKKMIFFYLENHHDIQVREVVLLSFNRIFKEFPSIPVDLIVEPFVKQLQVAQGSTYILNLFDIAFIKQVVAHPKLSVRSACMLAEFLMKLYLKNLVFSKMLMKCIYALSQRYIESEDFQEVIVRQSRQYLTAYYSLTQKRSKKQQHDSSIIAGQKRSLIVELLKLLIQLEIQDLNEKLKVMIGQSYSNIIDTKKYNDKGLFALLSIFGIPEALVQQIRNQQQNEFKDTDLQQAVEGMLPTLKIQSQRKHETLKRNYTSPKKLAIQPATIVEPPEQSFSEQNLLKKHNLGYKPQKLAPAARIINRSAHVIKPDNKVLNEIQKVKLKFIQQQSKIELLKLEEQKRQQWKREAIKGEILQKNISLGFPRIGDIGGKILFEFGSVREAALPSHMNLIHLNEEEDRDSKSIELTFKRQAKIIKVLFNIFSNTSQATRRLAGAQTQNEEPYISFTETIRLLKDWNLGKLPSKVIVSEIMKQLNSDVKKDRNVLMGVREEQFPELLTQFTAVLDIYDPNTRMITLPLGFKLDRLFKNIIEGGIQKFDDPQETAVQANFEKNGEVPSGYKRITDQVMDLRNTVRVGIPEPYKICVEVVDDILRGFLGTGPIENWSEIIDKVMIKRVDQKTKVKPQKTGSATQMRRNKSQDKLPKIVKEPTIEKEDELKEQRRQERLKRAKIELEEQRSKKMQEDAAKRRQKQEQMQKERKKQLQRKKEAQQKKQMIKQHKLKLDEEKQEKQREKKQQQQHEENRKKEQRDKFFRKQKEKLKEDFEERGMKAKQGAVSVDKKKQVQDIRRQQLSKKMNDIIAEDKKTKEKDHQQNRAIKQLLQDGQVRNLIDKYDIELKDIFKHYSQLSDFKIERTVKNMGVKGFSICVKDYNISPELHKLQSCLVLYRHTLRDSNVKEGLTYEQFLQILLRLATKSSKLLSLNHHQKDQAPGDNEFQRQPNTNEQTEAASLSPQIVERLFRHMKLETRRYK